MAKRPGPGRQVDQKRAPDTRADPGEDARAFLREMADVVPLAPDTRGRVRAAPVSSSRLPPPAAAAKSSARPPTAIPSPRSADDLGLGTESPADFTATGVDRRELRKLKRGDHEPTARLDLHGMTGEAAIDRATRFLESSHHRHRCIAIVHGRGLHSAGHVAILRTRIRTWLRQQPVVLAFSDAPRTDGGAGAVYVLLRK